MAGLFVEEIPLYPDYSIESRGMAILREIRRLCNGNAVILVFLGEILAHHLGEGAAQAVILTLGAKILVNLYQSLHLFF